MGFPGGASGKESICNAGDAEDSGLIPGLGRSPGGGHGNPFQYSYLENPMNGGAWRATVHRVAESQIRLKRLSMTHIVSLVRWFLLFNEVNQLYVYIYPLPLEPPSYLCPIPHPRLSQNPRMGSLCYVAVLVLLNNLK